MEPNKLTSIIIYGASGDLSKRKLIPALYHLFCKGRLPEKFRIIGLARSRMNNREFREIMQAAVQRFAADKYSQELWETFQERLFYYPFDLLDESAYAECAQHLSQVEAGPANRLFYLATAPEFFPISVKHMGNSGLVAEEEGWRRVIIEKPFGADVETARHLNEIVHAHLDEHQIYRIDHYLAKETVQNILVLRFGNAIFEPLWNRTYIESVQITAAESVDVGQRGSYYDDTGVLRDMFQNHLLQLLALVSMEAPASFDADAIRNEKVKLLSSVRMLPTDKMDQHLVVAQYEGFQDTEGVIPGSRTPTYAAMRLFLDNWRWQGVPFYLRSGKALSEKRTEILIQFKSPPHNMFTMPEYEHIRGNMLSICIQPDEGLHLRFETKVPDTPAEMRSVNMEFHYSDDFGEISIPEAYERLMLNALNGDASLFTRADGIEAAWRIVDPALRVCESGLFPTARYPKGSWGPKESDALLARFGNHWRLGCVH